jgi:hypothetical protein
LIDSFFLNHVRSIHTLSSGTFFFFFFFFTLLPMVIIYTFSFPHLWSRGRSRTAVVDARRVLRLLAGAGCDVRYDALRGGASLADAIAAAARGMGGEGEMALREVLGRAVCVCEGDGCEMCEEGDEFD